MTAAEGVEAETGEAPAVEVEVEEGATIMTIAIITAEDAENVDFRFFKTPYSTYSQCFYRLLKKKFKNINLLTLAFQKPIYLCTKLSA